MDMRSAKREGTAVPFPPVKRRKYNGTRKNARAVQIQIGKENVSTDRKTKSKAARGTRASHDDPILSDVCEPSSPVRAGATPTVPSRYQDLKEAIKSLHNAIPSSLLCRERELVALGSFLKSTVEANVAGSLYVAGPPGTGKTACVTHLLQKYKDSSLTVINVNCMGIQRPQAIFSRISEELFGEHRSSEMAEPLAKFVVSSKKMILIVLDEIDQLVQRGQEVLYTLFEWPSLPGSKVVLVGIANSLDFTDRFLPRLQTHLRHCQPQLLQFRPYTKDEIASILFHRLGDTGVIDPKAIEFCARKVSAVFGDLRKALDLCRSAVELAQTQQRSRLMGGERQLENPSHSCLVTMKEMATVIANDSSSSSLKDDSLPLQQKLVVCTLVVLARGSTSREVSLSQLQEGYRRVCERRQLKAESDGELVALCGYLETVGIVVVKGKRNEPRLAKITLKLQESEVEQLLKDKTLLSTILSEGL